MAPSEEEKQRIELDASVLSQIRGIGGEELLRRLARLFLEHTPVRLEEIRRAMAAGDWQRVTRAVHSLRSSSATLGFTGLADQAAEVERLATNEESERLRSTFPELAESTGAALESLRLLLEEQEA